jgi:hypothetical protein
MSAETEKFLVFHSMFPSFRDKEGLALMAGEEVNFSILVATES